MPHAPAAYDAHASSNNRQNSDGRLAATEPAKKQAYASRTISGDFIDHIVTLLDLSFAYVRSGNGVRHGLNGYTPHALPAYVSAVAAVESFLNEHFFGNGRMFAVGPSALDDMDEEQLDGLDVRTKLQLLPQLAFGRTLPRGGQPYQDFRMLVSVRNALVHYKMRGGPPAFLRPLVERGIALPVPDNIHGDDYIWIDKISSSEGLRWAYNTVAATLQAVVSLAPDRQREYLSPLVANRQVSNEDVRKALEARATA